MRFTHITVEQAAEQHSCVITLNRPERRNALSLEMMAELTAALDEIAPGNFGCDMIRTKPFWVSGHDAQPDARFTDSQAWAAS